MKNTSKTQKAGTKSQSPRPAGASPAVATAVKSAVKTTVSKKNGAARLIRSDKIAVRAYQIWQSRGCVHGGDQADWLKAEKELASASS